MATANEEFSVGVSKSDGLSAWREWQAGWPVVAAGVTGMMLSSLHAYSIGVMVAPIEAEFGWGRAQITSGMMICSLLSVLLSPFFGMFIDRFGPRRIALFGMAFYCLSLALLSTAASILAWWLLWTLLAVALLNTKPTVWIAAISGLFERSRGMALAILLSATGLSQALTPLVAYGLVERYGWRTAYLVMGAGAALVALPILWFWFSSRQDRVRISGPGAATVVNVPGLSARAGFRSGAFVRLGLAALAMSTAGSALTVNLVPVLSSTGLTRGVAVSLAGLSGVSAILGRIIGGALLDRFNARVVGGVAVLLPIITSAILLTAPAHIPFAVLAILLSGLAAGAEMDAIAYIAGRSFGLRNFGLLFGTLSGLLALGIGMGPTLANLVYDQTGSYNAVIWSIIPLSALTSLMFLTVAPYPEFDKAHDDDNYA